MLAGAAHRHVELAGDVVGGGLAPAAERVDDRAAALGQSRRNALIVHAASTSGPLSPVRRFLDQPGLRICAWLMRLAPPGAAGCCRRTRATDNHSRGPPRTPAPARAGPRSPRASAGAWP